MTSEALQGIITMLRTTAAERGETTMTLDEWRTSYGALGSMLPLREGVPVTPTSAGGVPAEWIGGNEAGPVADPGTLRPRFSRAMTRVAGRTRGTDVHLRRRRAHRVPCLRHRHGCSASHHGDLRA